MRDYVDSSGNIRFPPERESALLTRWRSKRGGEDIFKSEP
jgi:hypothetical protein